MLILGYELEDVLRVAVGLALGLLTVYRRELSSNRAYHPDGNSDADGLSDSLHRRLMDAGLLQEGDGNIAGDDIHNGGNSPLHRSDIRRPRSASALSSLAYQVDDDAHRHHRDRSNSSASDPTEELLESAGLFLSGGPFLAAAIAMFDHLMFGFTCFMPAFFVGAFAGMKAFVSALKKEEMRAVRDDFLPVEREHLTLTKPTKYTEMDERYMQFQQQHLYSVAWNAATEYFTKISAKLDGNQPIASSVHVGIQNAPLQGLSPQHRSKSTGNLRHLSDERSMTLLREMVAMAGRGGMDVTLLPSDAQIMIFSYLPPQDVLSFTCTNKAGRKLLDDGPTIAEEGNDDAIHISSGNTTHDGNDTSLLIWKALFERDYSWVLSEWKIGKEAFARSMTNCEEEIPDMQTQGDKKQLLLHHLTSMIMESEQFDTFELLPGHHNMPYSMKEFYFTFIETWLNYTLAGCNSIQKCLIGLHGHVFDISGFVEQHPGSAETLLLQAGRDATVFFESMGHTLNARKLALGMCEVVNAQCTRCHFLADEDRANGGPGAFRLCAGPLGPAYSNWGLIRPSCKSMDIKKDLVGFLIPRKRSRPRFQGGLHRIRERIKREEEAQLATAAQWGQEVIGTSGMFGSVQVYFDPFRGWRWWYTDRNFEVVYTMPQ